MMKTRVVIEICDATWFKDAHARMLNEYNAMPNLKPRITVKIAYPIQMKVTKCFPRESRTDDDGAYLL